MATPSVGEKLRRERESRDTSIEEIAEKTKIALRFLQALEKDEFDELPGKAFGKFYIRAYAEVLRFDPGPLIVDYDRERAAACATAAGATPPEPARPRRVEAEMARWREARRAGQREPREAERERRPVERTEGDSPPATDVGEEVVDEPTPPPALRPEEHSASGTRYDEAAALASILGPHEPAQGTWRRPRNIFAAVLCIGLVIVLARVLRAPSGPDDAAVANGSSMVGEQVEPTAPISTDGTNEPRDGEPVVEDTGPVSTEPPGRRTGGDAPRPAPAASAPITVAEFGVGRRVVDHRLEGRGRRFEEGSVVWFQTRVIGGSPGEVIRHVWFREGKVVQTVDLELGGAHWRTQSRKTLWGTGEWTVEALDEEDRVLARAEFVCVARGS